MWGKLYVSVTFPENYVKSLHKDAVFEVTVKELQRVPVEINDEIAKKMGLENLETKKSVGIAKNKN